MGILLDTSHFDITIGHSYKCESRFQRHSSIDPTGSTSTGKSTVFLRLETTENREQENEFMEVLVDHVDFTMRNL